MTGFVWLKKLNRFFGLLSHNHFVEDVILSSDAQYALSASWDKTLRLWDINSGNSTQLFRDHQGVCSHVILRHITSSLRNFLGCSLRSLLTGQSSDCLWVSGQDDQAVEHSG